MMHVSWTEQTQAVMLCSFAAHSRAIFTDGRSWLKWRCIYAPNSMRR